MLFSHSGTFTRIPYFHCGDKRMRNCSLNCKSKEINANKIKILQIIFWVNKRDVQDMRAQLHSRMRKNDNEIIIVFL